MGAERGVGRHDKGKVKVNASVNATQNLEDCAKNFYFPVQKERTTQKENGNGN